MPGVILLAGTASTISGVMMSSDVAIIALAVAVALVATAGICVGWQYWQEASVRQRRALVREAARWAVEAAELLHPTPGAGKAKLLWVLERLRARFPEFDEPTLERQAERAVRMMNDRQAVAGNGRANGKAPRYVE